MSDLFFIGLGGTDEVGASSYLYPANERVPPFDVMVWAPVRHLQAASSDWTGARVIGG